MTNPGAEVAAVDGSRPWWADTIGYQIYPRSFADADGDGNGDLRGIREHLGYLELIGIQTIWVNPFYRSPMIDGGYDVSDPRDVDPLFGTIEDARELIGDVHRRGMRLVVDLIPNHVSSDHPWFAAAVADGRGAATRRRFHFRDGAGEHGDLPPNNWRSIFGGPAWTRVTDGQWYLHLFDPAQPDLNWTSLDVWADLEETLRFWLDHGVDGFRIDVAHGMAKPDGLPDAPPDSAAAMPTPGVLPAADAVDPRFDNPGVHDVHRFIRRILQSYGDRSAIGEVMVAGAEEQRRYLRPDELHQCFGFELTGAAFEAAAIRTAIDAELGNARASGTTAVWTLSNHDVTRPVTRYGGGTAGLDRARAMLLLELALPGAVYLYNGEELGLPNVDIPDGDLRDPAWERSGHTERGRDALRLPIPWSGDAPPFGFTAGTSTWLPSPTEFAGLTVEAQLDDPTSTLSLVRRAIELRTGHPAVQGDRIDWYGAPPDCLAFRRSGGLVCAVNASAGPVELPPGRLLISSAPLVDGRLPADAAAWLVPSVD